jgi:hypothetical protein
MRPRRGFYHGRQYNDQPIGQSCWHISSPRGDSSALIWGIRLCSSLAWRSPACLPCSRDTLLGRAIRNPHTTVAQTNSPGPSALRLSPVGQYAEPCKANRNYASPIKNLISLRLRAYLLFLFRPPRSRRMAQANHRHHPLSLTLPATDAVLAVYLAALSSLIAARLPARKRRACARMFGLYGSFYANELPSWQTANFRRSRPRGRIGGN